MRFLVLIGVAAALAAAAFGARQLGLWGAEGSDATLEVPRIDVGGLLGGRDGPLTERELAGTGACQRLAALAAVLAAERPGPREFLRRLGRETAGIRPGLRGLADLARGGRDLIPGRGFQTRFSDGSDGQARHFTGIAVAATYGGERATRYVSIFARGDEPNSADGLLTEQALTFTRLLESGRLAVADAGGWIHDRVCEPDAASLLER